ncbi:hypothetical protein VNO78_33637 [Psophocarpus tetragonolobus]|uniref:Uncharacterized protein n=1 Tax=Psophocarpus tetragonolobus TaxID=3891 RepID=A0AAN9P4C8_PSOTE
MSIDSIIGLVIAVEFYISGTVIFYSLKPPFMQNWHLLEYVPPTKLLAFHPICVMPVLWRLAEIVVFCQRIEQGSIRHHCGNWVTLLVGIVLS